MYTVRWPEFRTKGEALTALKNFDDIFDKYGEASVADLYESCGGFSTLFSDNSWGWNDKTAFDVVSNKLEFEYKIIGPDPVKLNLEETHIHTNDNVSRHSEICQQLNKLYEAKNHDYGDSFHQTWLEEGYAMARIRLVDKLNRFKMLSKLTVEDGGEQEVKDESIRDTLIDLANYAIMTVMELDREKGEEK